jgi:uncharacterized protein YbaP (TraB family)
MRRATFYWLLAAVLAFAIGGTARAEQPQAQAAQTHLLWKVTGPAGVVYLLGTIHAGTADLYPLPPVIEASFKRSNMLIEEINMSDDNDQDVATRYMAQNGIYPPMDRIANHLSEDTMDRLVAYAQTGQLPANYTRVRPWLLSLMIGQLEVKRLGLDKQKGLDRHFFEEATQMHKPVGALETGEYQIMLLSSFSPSMQDKVLRDALIDVEKHTKLLDEILHAWKAGDAEAMAAAATETVREHPDLAPVMKELVDDRNDMMTEKITQFLGTPKTYFVAVGAAHLVGEHGVVNQLRAKHYTVEQL